MMSICSVVSMAGLAFTDPNVQRVTLSEIIREHLIYFQDYSERIIDFYESYRSCCAQKRKGDRGRECLRLSPESFCGSLSADNDGTLAIFADWKSMR